MIDHTGVPVSDFDRAAAFYTKALAPLGYSQLMTYGPVAGFGEPGKPDFWISITKGPISQIHVAFRTNSRKIVRDFYEAAIAAGGKDNGAPGVRADYHPNYYAAFVHDPDGHNVEVVCHEAYLD